MRLFRRLRKLVSVPRLVVLLVVVAVAAGTLSAVHITVPSGGPVNAGILQPGSQGPQPQGLPWWDPRGWFSSGAHGPASHAVPGTELALPSRPRVLRQAVAPPVRRVRELTAQRTQYSRTYELSDGRRQAVISAGPVNYRDAAGRWEPIDTTVTRSPRAGFSFANTTNVFGSYFSSDPSRLVRFELPSGGWLQTGLPGGRRVAPRVAGNEVTYAGILPGVTLSYAVSPSGLKESIVLASRSADVAGLRFTVTAGGGLRPGGLRGGATGWFRGNMPVPALISPAPFMTDGPLPGRQGRAPARGELVPVAQRTSWDAARSAESVVLVPDRGWLDSRGRVWPVTVDPTITIAPAPCPPTTAGCARNTFIESGANAGANFYNFGWPLKVGTGASSVDRTLVQFPTSAIPANSQIDSADLNMYWDDSFYQGSLSVQPPQTVQAYQATTAWDPTTVTWNSNIGLGTEGMNRVSVFSTGGGASAKGAWPTQASTAAANGSSYRYDQDTTAGDTFTFVPQPLTEPGTYQVDEHYVASSSASSAAPVTVNYQGGSKAFTVNQQSGSGGVWTTLGSEPFAAGTAESAVEGDGTASATVRVEADGVRFTKFAQVTDASAQAGQGLLGDRWDSFAVRNIVQNWADGQANDGFVLKAANEGALNTGGPEYERSGNFYTGETATYPQLVVTYGQLTSVTFNPITVIRDTGANLSWTPYVNSTGNSGYDLAGYQVYRSVFQSFTPSPDTLVANVPAGTTSFDDTTSVPAPPTASTGNAFYYMIAVRTTNGTVVPGPVQLVRLPVAGKTVAVIFSTGAATLSSAQPTANLQSLFGFPWTETGDNGGTGCSTCYGTTRSVFTFGSVASAIPAGSRITLGQLKLWGIANNGSTAANYQVHNITGSFTAANATWNSTANQFDATALDTGVTGMTTDPQAEWLTATSAIQSWLDTPSSQHGLMVKLQDESSTGPQDQELWLTTGAAEQWLRPYLVITYADPASAYEAPATPHVSQASSSYTTPVTVTDTTTGAWGTNMQLGYHWATPDGTIVSSGTSAATLSSTLNSGAGTALTATVTTPPAIAGGTRSGYQLAWDMYNKTNGTWASSNTTTPNLAGTGGAGTVPAAGQVTSVAETAETLGLEKYFQYTPMATGSGSELDNNDANGNTVWNYSPFSNPSNGFRTFVRLDYNSMDTSESSMGFGWSLQASTLTRLGTPLDFQPPGNPTSMTLTDANGGSHTFTLNTTVTPNAWTSPPGFHYYLQSYAACNVNGKDNPAKAWLITAPDATKFYFDCDGYQTAVIDKNGNEADFSYSQRKSENSPEEFLDYITDPAHRQTLTLTYYTKGQSYSYINDTTFPPTVATGTNLTNPDIVDQVASITDISGRKISFLYDDQGLMSQMTDGPNTVAADGPVWSGPASTAKVFAFGYDPTQGNKNVKLVSVTDPRNDTTCLYYYPPSAAFKWSLQAITSRRADPATSTGAMAACPTTPVPAYETQFAYTAVAPGANPLLPNGGVQTAVTDPLGHVTGYLTDTLDRPVQITDPVGRKTTLAFDSDNNLTTQTENNGAVTKWTWDPNTGYPLTMQDAANQATGDQNVYSYQTSLGGHVAFLTSSTSPLGNITTYGLDAFGNVKSVTTPDGNVSGATAGSYTTSYTYNSDGTLATATDPDGNITKYPAYDPTGQPTQLTDPRGNTTTLAYSPTGQVTSNTDAYGHTITTTQYDVFGRTGLVTTRKSATQNVYTAAPVYDGNDNVTTSYQPSYSVTTAGAATTNVYNPDDQVTSATTPPDSGTGTGPTTTKAYNNDDTLASVTRPNGNASGANPAQYTTTYAYYPDQKVQTVTDGLGDQTSYTYDNVGNTFQVTDPDKNTTTTTYDLDHRVQQVTDPNGNYTQTTFDADGRVTQSRDKDGNVTLSNYDASGQLIQQQVPVQAPGQPVSYATTQYAYDQAGNRTQVLTPLAVQNGSSLFTSPPSACTTTPVTSPCPFTQVMTYNPDNQVATQQTPAGGDGPYSALQVTSYSYDNNGRQSQVTAPPSNGDLPATGLNTTGYTYWDNGWSATSTDPRGIVTSYDYAPDGQQSSRVLTSADGGMTRGMSWSYYPDGKLQQVTDNGVPTGSSTEMVDAGDAAATATGGTNGSAWATGTCPAAPAQPLPQPGTPPLQPACGGPTYRTHPIAAAGSTTDAFTWHLNVPADGNYTIYVKYPALPAGTTAATGANYTITTNGTSTGGTPVTVTGIDQTQNAGTSSGGTWVKLGEWQFNHGVSSQQVTLNPAGSTGATGSVVVASAVEAVRDTTGITNTAVHGDTYTYDLDGNTTGITGTAGTGTGNTAVTIAATPDVLDRTSSITETWANGGPVNTANYTYDAASNVKTMTHTITQGGTTTTDQNAAYNWNNLNLLQNQTDGPTTGDSAQKTTAFTYTPAGQLQTQTQPNGNLITDQYTAARQVYTKAECTNNTAPVIPAYPITSPTAITCGTGGQLISADAYTYDVNGQQTQDLSNLMSADSTGTYLSHTWNDTYNGVGQLTQVSDGSTQTEAYQHDPQGNIISQTVGGSTTTYSYSRGLLQSSAIGGQTSTYNYDPLGRLDTVTGPSGSIQQSSTYDGFDNLISSTTGSGSSAVTTTYSYDPLNRVTSQTTGTNTTSYSYLGLTSQVSSETDPGGITKTYGYTPGGTRLFQTTTGNPTTSLNGTAYYSYNNHSDVEALTGPSGTPAATYGYTAYGSPVTSMFTGADAGNANPGPNVVPYNSYRFNAKQWDPGSGQYNMGARNYDPGLGSFTTRDMYAGSGADMALTSDPFSGGAYAFGDANPISNIEIDGHTHCDAGYCPTIRQIQQVTQIQQTAYNNDVAWYQQQAAAAENQAESDCRSGECILNTERNFQNPAYAGKQVQQYLIGQQIQAANHQAYLEQQQQAQQSSGGCGILGISCVGRWVSQHWNTITNVATWVGVGACIIFSAGACTILGAAIAIGTYLGNGFIAHQSFVGSNLVNFFGNIALAGLGGAVSRLGAESLSAWFHEVPLSDLASIGAKGAHVAPFNLMRFVYLQGPKLASNTVHAFTTPDFMICANQADFQC